MQNKQNNSFIETTTTLLVQKSVIFVRIKKAHLIVSMSPNHFKRLYYRKLCMLLVETYSYVDSEISILCSFHQSVINPVIRIPINRKNEFCSHDVRTTLYGR